MTCNMADCDHAATHDIRLSTSGRLSDWRTLCECCIEVWMMLAQISGARYEVRDIAASTDITTNDVAIAQTFLSDYEGNMEGLFG